MQLTPGLRITVSLPAESVTVKLQMLSAADRFQ